MRPLALALLVAAPWHARAYCINWGANCECPGACQSCSEPAASGATQCEVTVGALASTVHSDGSYAQRTVFDLLFFIVVLVLLLNIIFGIVLDTFATMREESNERKAIEEGYCFICMNPKVRIALPSQRTRDSRSIQLLTCLALFSLVSTPASIFGWISRATRHPFLSL